MIPRNSLINAQPKQPWLQYHHNNQSIYKNHLLWRIGQRLCYLHIYAPTHSTTPALRGFTHLSSTSHIPVPRIDDALPAWSYLSATQIYTLNTASTHYPQLDQHMLELIRLAYTRVYMIKKSTYDSRPSSMVSH